MLSEEASLIGEFGQPEEDWEYSAASDLSTYGMKAKVTTINYLTNKVQNKNYNGAGPHAVSAEYIDGVTWNGNSSDVEYINTRATLNYAPFYFTELTELHQWLEEQPKTDLLPLAERTDTYISSFIFGGKE